MRDFFSACFIDISCLLIDRYDMVLHIPVDRYVSATVFPYGDYRDVTVNTMYNNHGVNGPGFTLTGVMEGVAVKDGGPWNVLAWWGTQDWDLL
ncbi:hypothetical protein DPMN_122094 [Dreissena polymorpha]|uniref:Uncharacterized protein n=1 Tax=Dreissena polymorpha TaxID=45954 RepID=A0A9D4GR95_DREPO|nr:hypothetical protein DPMN_122094 [Dreissena polymorpha]